MSEGPAAVATAFLAAVLLIHPAAASAATANPHEFMADQTRCQDCHTDSPVRPGGFFVRDIGSLCGDCHSQDNRMSHPVDIRPSRMPTPALPLDADGSMTCVTCHDPHSSPYDDTPRVHVGLVENLRQALSGEGYRTYYLRAPSINGRLCLSCHEKEDFSKDLLKPKADAEPEYAGSEVCRECHAQIHRAWKDTSHARTLQDLRANPGAASVRFTGEEAFRPEDVIFAVGTHYTQRFVVDRGGELMVAKGIWQIEDGRWGRSYWKEQPWREFCAGCHLTGYDPFRGTLTEAGVGCEMCHGPGARHTRTGNSNDIVNPARLGQDARDVICASCHTHGHDRTGMFRYPVGYTPGEDLSSFFHGLNARAGQGAETFRGDGTIEDRLRSFRYWADNFFRHNRFTCKLCRNFVAEPDPAAGETAAAPAHHCLGCHDPSSLKGKDHEFKTGAETGCSECHKPMVARDGRPSIHDHKFFFTPSASR